MPKLPALKPKEIIKIIEKSGFIFIRQKGSHRIYTKGNLRITIAYHNKEVKKKTLKHIIEQSGLDIKEFLKLI